MANSRYYSSIAAVTNLQVTANPGDTSIQVASSSGWPGTFPFIISLDYGSANEELVLVTAGGPTSFTVTRAYDGTSASTHNAGAVVRHVSAAVDFTDSRTHESSTTGVHGVSGSFVDTTSVQTLTNKTLTAPTINNPTIGGTVAGTPTHSGTNTFTNGIAVSGLSSPFSRANASDPVIRVKTDAAGFSQLIINADGSHTWGPGTGVGDTVLARTGVAVLGLTGGFTASGTITATGNITSSATLQGVNLIATNANLATVTNDTAFTGHPTFAPTTATDAAIIPDTVANGWSLDGAAGRKAAGVTTVRVNVNRVGGNIVASGTGNIPDTKVGTLAAGWRPVDGTMITNYDMSGIATGSVSIGNDGIVTIKSLSAGNTIGLADTVNFSLTFVSAT